MIGSALLSMAALSGCHASVDVGTTKEISKEKLASGVSDALKAKVGTTPTTSKCDGPLKGEKGATQRCWISDSQGQVYGVNVTTTTLDGGRIQFDIAVDDKPTDRPA
ncbi:DUF4333 domain-containing protein [Mycobacteroides chelonae]|uniref:DUF4333 domain-containing protein n=1 Tax=Mycobacteroides chelonae TaxID=1774 RepID=UPI0039E7868C